MLVFWKSLGILMVKSFFIFPEMPYVIDFD